MGDGLAAIPIEERDQEEVLRVQGQGGDGELHSVAIAPSTTAACNPAFDVTPARLVTGLITERGLVRPPAKGCWHCIRSGADGRGRPARDSYWPRPGP